MIKEFIWDFDGTLFDTYPVMVKALVQAVQDIGGQADAQQVYQEMRQGSVGEAEKQFAKVLGVEKAQIRRSYQHYEKLWQVEPQPFPGALAVVKQISAMGGHNFLLTHRNAGAKQFLVQAGLDQYFTDYVTSEQPFPRKPAPDSLNYLIEKHHLDRKASVMVGDRNLDVDAGNNAGIAGYLFDPDQLIQVTSHPGVQVTKLTELLPLLTK